jgi:hypothetical protein
VNRVNILHDICELGLHSRARGHCVIDKLESWVSILVRACQYINPYEPAPPRLAIYWGLVFSTPKIPSSHNPVAVAPTQTSTPTGCRRFVNSGWRRFLGQDFLPVNDREQLMGGCQGRPSSHAPFQFIEVRARSRDLVAVCVVV